MCCTPPASCSTKTLVDAIEALGIDEVHVRTPLTCDTRYGLCAMCYGRDLGRGVLGQRRRSGGRDRRAVDRRTGHAADHAYLPHRRRGLARGGGQQVDIASRTAPCASPRPCVTWRTGRVNRHFPVPAKCDRRHGRERERHKVPYGATLHRPRMAWRSRAARGGHLGSAYPPDHYRVRRHGTLRERRRRRDRCQQTDEVTGLSNLGDRSETLELRQGSVRPQVKLFNEGRGSENRRHRPPR